MQPKWLSCCLTCDAARMNRDRKITCSASSSSKLAVYIDNRYLCKEASEFVQFVTADIHKYLKVASIDKVLLFPPVDSYYRLLTHRIVEEFSDLCSFSVGEGDDRRTVVALQQSVLNAMQTNDSNLYVSEAVVKVRRTVAMNQPRWVQDQWQDREPGPATDRASTRTSKRKPRTMVGGHDDRWLGDKGWDASPQSPWNAWGHDDRCESPSETHSPGEAHSGQRSSQGCTNTGSLASDKLKARTRSRRPDVQIYVPKARRQKREENEPSVPKPAQDWSCERDGHEPEPSQKPDRPRSARGTKHEAGIYVPRPRRQQGLRDSEKDEDWSLPTTGSSLGDTQVSPELREKPKVVKEKSRRLKDEDKDRPAKDSSRHKRKSEKSPNQGHNGRKDRQRKKEDSRKSHCKDLQVKATEQEAVDPNAAMTGTCGGESWEPDTYYDCSGELMDTTSVDSTRLKTVYKTTFYQSDSPNLTSSENQPQHNVKDNVIANAGPEAVKENWDDFLNSTKEVTDEANELGTEQHCLTSVNLEINPTIASARMQDELNLKTTSVEMEMKNCLKLLKETREDHCSGDLKDKNMSFVALDRMQYVNEKCNVQDLNAESSSFLPVDPNLTSEVSCEQTQSQTLREHHSILEAVPQCEDPALSSHVADLPMDYSSVKAEETEPVSANNSHIQTESCGNTTFAFSDQISRPKNTEFRPVYSEKEIIARAVQSIGNESEQMCNKFDNQDFARYKVEDKSHSDLQHGHDNLNSSVESNSLARADDTTSRLPVNYEANYSNVVNADGVDLTMVNTSVKYFEKDITKNGAIENTFKSEIDTSFNTESDSSSVHVPPNECLMVGEKTDLSSPVVTSLNDNSCAKVDQTNHHIDEVNSNREISERNNVPESTETLRTSEGETDQSNSGITNSSVVSAVPTGRCSTSSPVVRSASPCDTSYPDPSPDISCNTASPIVRPSSPCNTDSHVTKPVSCSNSSPIIRPTSPCITGTHVVTAVSQHTHNPSLTCNTDNIDVTPTLPCDTASLDVLQAGHETTASEVATPTAESEILISQHSTSNPDGLADTPIADASGQKEQVVHQDVSMETEEDDAESWDLLFDDNGDSLDPSVLEELTAAVGRVTVQKPQFDYYSYQPKDPDLDMEAYSHLIEIYDFSSELTTRDLIFAFKEFEDKGFDIKWVDDTHAIGVFSSSIAAKSALFLVHPLMKVRPLHLAARQTKLKAKRTAEFLQPYKPRPQTVASVARNMVVGALGLSSRIPREKREEERKKLREAREKKKAAGRQKRDIWDGKIGKCAMDDVS